jgi:hypothetical protein
MANLEVDATQLAKDGDEFNNLASVAYSIYGALARGASLITFPGDDPVSKLFSEQWNPLVSGIQGMLLGFRDGMTGVASNVFSTASLYQKSNDVNTESVTPPPTVLK